MKNNANEMKLKTLVAQYCEVEAERLTPEMRFREDLGFSSLGFMSFLGDLEDTFDVELDETSALQVNTLGEALALLGGAA